MHTYELIIGLGPHKASNTIAVLHRHEILLFRDRFDHGKNGIDCRGFMDETDSGS
jgi:hypothetical protein